ncbi:hypothetical protein [Microbulbifer sp. YPW1]|uniref:hypothetical protein n=1 Tax=Microbulbifer sp. YPW1 TaxID=2745199 RepID=UPI00159AE961|nr:hypothetical protein [Microbulbifer sp. YPW1]QKX16230.1 hypothetical protein HUW35_04115 [Microbulbifer sp. YPW1]
MSHKFTRPTPVSLAIIAMASIFTTACNGIQFNTNAGPYVSDRLSSTLVREYTISEISRYNATTLGFVNASYCQDKLDERKASKSALVRDLKVRTQKMGGNGLVVEACGTTKFNGCLSYIECRGVAYAVPERKGDDLPANAASTHF